MGKELWCSKEGAAGLESIGWMGLDCDGNGGEWWHKKTPWPMAKESGGGG